MLLKELRLKNQEEKITFLLPTKYISEEAAQLGLLLDHIANKRRRKRTIHRTFFASCHWETLSGTVKLMRHHYWLSQGSRSSSIQRVLIYDPSNELRSVFNPFSDVDESRLLVPGLQFESSFQKVCALIQGDKRFIGFICCWDGLIPMEEIDRLFSLCKAKNVFTALDEALLDNWYLERAFHVFSSPPDVYILGENIANKEIPFACFTMTAEMYSPWNNIASCLTHSSSYSGNTISISMILALFRKHGLDGPERFIAGNKKAKYRAYATYVNPSIAWIFYSTHLSPEVMTAKGSWLTERRTHRKILDGIAGSGCCLRGHNPSDLIEEVLQEHDPCHDYWEDLCQKFLQLTDLPHVFPAVSGSSATDVGIILSLLANQPRKRIITFKHNYSGKSLISLNVTRFEYFRSPFYPLYFDVLEIDPFQMGASEELRKELLSGEVALVWFEILQGQSLDFIPDDIIETINTHQSEGGYLVGVDEILTGMFRTGNFLCSEGKILNPDIIALAKGVSDMVFPMACVLVSDRVYQSSSQNNPVLVEKLKSYFVNQIGAHIALHGLKKALEMNLGKHVRAMGNLFKELTQEAVTASKLHQSIVGEGLLIYLKLNKKSFPINILKEETVEFLMSCYYLARGNILFLNSRITPSLTINSHEVSEFSRKIVEVLNTTNSLILFLFCLKKMIHIYTLCILQRIREKFLK